MTTKTKTMSRKNYYDKIGRKEEFFYEQEDKEHKTDQSQFASASIVEMAKKFGIDAIIAKAEQKILEVGPLQDELFGNDLSNMLKSKEEILKTKMKLNNIFERIPARIRKDLFNDRVENFITDYVSENINTLTELNKIGMVSDTQLLMKRDLIKRKEIEIKEQKIQNDFIKELEKAKGGLYEKFKDTGKINLDTVTKLEESKETI